MSTFLDLTGQVFGRLTVVRYIGRAKRGLSNWFCLCSCGNTKVVTVRELRMGDTRSCGCLRREVTGNNSRTHGKRKTPEYSSWAAMISRCTNPNVRCYDCYGGRGIKVCDSWLNSFENFYADMGPKPSSEYSIERVDHNNNYCPENCKWATMSEQARNRRSTLKVTFNGITKPLSSWAEELNVSYHLLYNRLFRLNWTTDKTFTQPCTT